MIVVYFGKRKKAQQRFYVLRKLRKFNFAQELLIRFHTRIFSLFSELPSMFVTDLKLTGQEQTAMVNQVSRKDNWSRVALLWDLYWSRVKKKTG